MDSKSPAGSLPDLSIGFVQTINQDFDAANPPPAVVQIVSIKVTDTDRGTRHRVIVSDGQYVQQGMLSSQLNSLVDSNEINKYSVVQLKKFTVNLVSNAKILMILDLDVVNNTITEKIGNPVVYGSAPDAPAPTVQNSSAPSSPVKRAGSISPTKSRQNYAHSAFDHSKIDVFPIASLNPYQTKWAIKARVTNKTEIRSWSNARGEGRLFSVDLIDDSGEIRATGFNEAVDKFYDLFEIGKIYQISRGSIKAAKKQFTSIKNDYEVNFDLNTTVQLAEDQAAKIPVIMYNFVEIAKIAQTPKDSVIDVIGVVKEAGEPTTTKTKFQKELLKRDLVLVDTSLKSIRVTIWGNLAETLDLSGSPVLAAKGLRVSDYNGCSLSAVGSSILKLNPDVPVAHALRSWYDVAGAESTFSSVSTTQASVFDDSAQRKMAKDIEYEQLGTRLDAPDIFTIKGTITNIPHEKTFYYPACPETGSKVVQESQGWYSERTKKHYPECDYRYILKIQAMDATGGIWMSAFNETAVSILKKPAGELVMLRENGHTDALDEVFKEANFQEFVFRVRSKAESYQGENYTRHQVIACKPVDYISDSKYLLSAIAGYAK